jgi:predicted dehydrogenase
MSKAHEVLSVLIVGCGEIAGGYDEANDGTTVLSHAGAYRADSRMCVAACVEPDATRRREFMDRWQIEDGYADLDACLDARDDFDVVSICTPTETHEALLARLVESAAKIVFCEKPMTGDPARSEALRDAYNAAGKKICVNYLRRWDPEMDRLREEMASGAWGPVRTVTAFYAKGLMHTGSHMLDLLQHLVGPLSPRAALRRTEEYSAEDPTVDALLSGPGGCPVYLLGSDSKDYARFEVEIACARGILRIEDSGFRVRRRRTEDHRLYPGRTHLGAGEAVETGLDRALAGAVDNIHAAITRGVALASDADGAIAIERLCRDISQMPITGDLH